MSDHSSRQAVPNPGAASPRPDVVDRAAQFVGEFAQPGNAWRAEARELIIDLADEVKALRVEKQRALDEGDWA